MLWTIFQEPYVSKVADTIEQAQALIGVDDLAEIETEEFDADGSELGGVWVKDSPALVELAMALRKEDAT